jgi:hypothetical protein
MKILHLTLKKKWFDLILSGEKKEEYREIKRYWIHRLCDEVEYETGITWEGVFKKFDNIEFINGYGKNAPKMIVECKGINIGQAKPEWSDNWKGDVFIIKLGKIIETKNCETRLV